VLIADAIDTKTLVTTTVVLATGKPLELKIPSDAKQSIEPVDKSSTTGSDKSTPTSSAKKMYCN
jgi:hypothetical protein